MASSSMASFLPPSTAGPTPQMKAYTKLLVQTAQTGVIADFSQYLVDHPVTPQKDISKRIQEFLLHGTLDQQHEGCQFSFRPIRRRRFHTHWPLVHVRLLQGMASKTPYLTDDSCGGHRELAHQSPQLMLFLRKCLP